MEDVDDMKMRIKGTDIDKSKLEEINKELVSILKNTFVDIMRITKENQKDNQIELSVAITTNLAGFIKSLSPKKALELCIEMAHTIMMVESKEVDREDITKLANEYFKNEK